MDSITKRIRRTAEQRLADLEKQQAKIMERQRAALAKIEEAKKACRPQPSRLSTRDWHASAGMPPAHRRGWRPDPRSAADSRCAPAVRQAAGRAVHNA